MSRAPRPEHKTTTTAPAPADPQTVRVRVTRAYVGSPDVGEVLDVTDTRYLRTLIARGFLKKVSR